MKLLMLSLLLTMNCAAQTVGILDSGGYHGDVVTEIIRRANPDLKIVRIDIFKGKKFVGKEAIIAGVKQLKALGCDRINMSLGGFGLHSDRKPGFLHEELETVQAYAGAVNRSTDLLHYPANDTNCIAVTCPGRGKGDIFIGNANFTSWATAVACGLGLLPGSSYGETNGDVELKKVRVGKRRTTIVLKERYKGDLDVWIGSYRFKVTLKRSKRRFAIRVPRFGPEEISDKVIVWRE